MPSDSDYAYHYRDMIEHLYHVHRHLLMMQIEISQRIVTHDRSKFSSEENDTYASVTPKLRGLTYGTSEYRNNLKELGPAVKHHYEHNRHHPEHFENGLKGMNLIDLIEMICDWAAAVKRHDDGDIYRSLDINRDKFEMDTQVYAILKNTIPLLGKKTLSSEDTQVKL